MYFTYSIKYRTQKSLLCIYAPDKDNDVLAHVQLEKIYQISGLCIKFTFATESNACALTL